jgi:quercetin dioxygenase-like cupin family protein
MNTAAAMYAILVNMQVRKSRWSKVYESAEEELVQLLERKHIAARRWAAEEGEEIASQQFPTDMQLWCAEGQLTCTVAGQAYSMQTGDVLNIPAGLDCTMRARLGGCVCYESAATPQEQEDTL